MRTAVMLSVLLSTALVAEAEAQGRMRAAEHGESIGVRRAIDETRYELLVSVNGGAFEPRPEPGELLDWVMQRDGSLIALVGLDEANVAVERWHADGTTRRVVSLPRDGEHHLVRRGDALAVLGPMGAAVGSLGGRWRSVAFERRDPEGEVTEGLGYGFYAARGRITVAGTLEVLAPQFNTCGSSDRLEGLTMVRVTDDRVMVRSEPTGALSVGLVSGAHGQIYGLRWDGRECHLATPWADVVGGVPSDDCSLVGDVVAGFTGMVAGRTILRVRGERAIALGTLDEGAIVEDVTPDHRGRVVVLTTDGAVRRYGSRGVEELLAPLPLTR